MRSLSFLVPGDPASLTGGYAYDRAIVAGLRAAGWAVRQPALAEGFPWPDEAALAAAAACLEGLPEGSLVVADGLAFGAMPALAERHAARLRWVALVHHPLALETGLDGPRQRRLFESERRALAVARAVIVTSDATGRALHAYGVPGPKVHVVRPGTPPAPRARGSGPAPASLSLLCVATVTPRKGHAVLVDALAGLADRDWVLHCVGSVTRDRPTAAALRDRIAAHGLADRILLHGELPAGALDALYDGADAAVLATFFEGYGMSLAEALARGLPVVSTRTGAIAQTVPAGAGVLVPPGDVAALRGALARLMDEPAWRATLAEGARAAGARLPGWPDAVAAFDAVLRAVADMP